MARVNAASVEFSPRIRCRHRIGGPFLPCAPLRAGCFGKPRSLRPGDGGVEEGGRAERSTGRASSDEGLLAEVDVRRQDAREVCEPRRRAELPGQAAIHGNPSRGGDAWSSTLERVPEVEMVDIGRRRAECHRWPARSEPGDPKTGNLAQSVEDPREISAEEPAVAGRNGVRVEHAARKRRVGERTQLDRSGVVGKRCAGEDGGPRAQPVARVEETARLLPAPLGASSSIAGDPNVPSERKALSRCGGRPRGPGDHRREQSCGHPRPRHGAQHQPATRGKRPARAPPGANCREMSDTAMIFPSSGRMNSH